MHLSITLSRIKLVVLPDIISAIQQFSCVSAKILEMIGLVMWPSFQKQVRPALPGSLGKSYFATACEGLLGSADCLLLDGWEATRCSVCGRSERVPKALAFTLPFRADLPDLHAVKHPRAADGVPLDSWGHPTNEPLVLGWMPAASLYFRDPDGNMLELLAMLSDHPQPELGIVGWSRWNEIRESGQGAMQ